MNSIEFKNSDKVFNSKYKKNLKNTAPTQIYFGGASSGKSFFILAQRTPLDVLRSDRNFLIVRNVGKSNRNSTFNEIRKGITGLKLSEAFTVNKTEMTITAANGNQILFAGLDDVEKLKSITPEKGVITDIVIEEGTEVKYGDYKQLTKRLRGKTKSKKRITMMFNPIYQAHWIYKEFFQGNWTDSEFEYRDSGLYIQKSTYRDNNFLEDDDIERIESETDPYYRDVYVKGSWGVLGNVIFKNWHVEDLSELKKTCDRRLDGLDWGYSDDPAAYTSSYLDKKRKILYVLDELFVKGMDNQELAELLKPKLGRRLLVCDSAEPKSVKEIKKYGINATGAKKGPGSLITGYRWLQGLQIIVDKSCTNVINELTVHKYKEDKSGLSLNVPMDKDNHGIDSIRYACESEMTSCEAGLRFIEY